jgi:hypothetical protein
MQKYNRTIMPEFQDSLQRVRLSGISAATSDSD